MIAMVLHCILWSRPEVKIIDVPVSEYAMATVSEDFRDFTFYADVIEEKMNSVKLTHIASGSSSEAYAPNDYQQQSLSLKLTMPDAEATIDCEIKK